jgi:putative tricarboxylic transport membrane protein
MKLITDRIDAIVMLIISIVYCYSASTLDADFNPTQEKYYPFALSIVMVVLSLGLLVWPSMHTISWPKGKNLTKIGLTFCAILTFSLVLHKIGFLISASVLMGICMWVFEADRKWIVPISILVAIIFYFIFDRILGLNLPAGILNFF